MVLKNIETINKIIKFLDVPVMDIRTEECYNHRFFDSCSRCLDICPVHAITLSPGPEVNEKDCVLCGACSTVCPNGVIGMIDSSDDNIIHRINELFTEFDIIRFQCSGCSGRFRIRHKKPSKNTGVITIPCLGRLDETILLYGYLRKPGGMDIAPCNDRCPYTDGMKAFEESSRRVSRLLEMSNTRKPRINDKEMDNGSSRLPGDHAHGRRDFIIESGKRAIEIAFNIGEGDYRGRYNSNQRRERLISLILEHGLTGLIEEADKFPFAEVGVKEDLCDLCGLCERLCPSNALSLEMSEGLLQLNFRISKCTNSGICGSLCPTGAIEIVNAIDLSSLGRGETCLREGKTEVCVDCSQVFFISNEGQKICSICMKTRNVMDDLSSKARTIRTRDD